MGWLASPEEVGAAQVHLPPRRLVPCRFYPFYYAPLVSDLAKHATTVAKTKGITAKEAPDIGEESDSVPGSWAPPHGPVRPLVQLMAVLPPARWVLLNVHVAWRSFELVSIKWQLRNWLSSQTATQPCQVAAAANTVHLAACVIEEPMTLASLLHHHESWPASPIFSDSSAVTPRASTIGPSATARSSFGYLKSG